MWRASGQTAVASTGSQPARQRGEATVPTSIGLEKATNPFLRAPALVARPGRPDYEAFAEIRAAKDSFRG